VQEFGSIEHPRGSRGRLASRRPSRLRRPARPDHRILSFEDRTGQRTLSAVVGAIWVGAQSQQRISRLGMPVVGGQHQQGVARHIGVVCRDPMLDIRPQSLSVSGAGVVEACVGDRDQLQIRRAVDTVVPRSVVTESTRGILCTDLFCGCRCRDDRCG